jgi:uncharacterized membrane protein
MSMTRQGGHSAAGFDGRDSLYISLVPLPTVLLIAVLGSDVLYWSTAAAFFSRASEWLLGAALATGVIAAGDGLIRYVSIGCIRPSRACRVHVSGDLMTLLLSLWNLIYRLNEDGGRGVVPTGISLTFIALCLLFATARLDHGIAIDAQGDDTDDPEPP